MVKRIVSGIFILTALGALGVILAGALTSGEQLIVRFLTAVTVAALALYVISDLRLQGEQDDLPTDRNDVTSDRPKAPAEAKTGARGRNGGERSTRRDNDATVQPVPNFEAIEPVTARARVTTPDDPTGTVTGSRLVPPSPERTERVVPPHPLSGRTDAVAGRMSPPAADDVMDDAPGALAGTAADEQAGHRQAAQPEFVIPPDERPPSSGSVIATTSFTYSGRTDSFGVEWPAKPPVSEHSIESELDDDESASVGTADAPTAELPALIGLPTEGSGHDSLLAAFAAEFDDPRQEDVSGSTPSEPIADLFAVDTAEIPPIEPAEPASAAEGDPTVATPLIRRIEAADYATPPRTDHLDLREPAGAVSIDRVDPPVAAAPSTPERSPERLTAAIRSGEVQVINSLISQGMLTTSGPITDRDVRTMVYVAFTSNELRKLILAGGTPDGIRAGDLDLGEVELFDESRFAPPPKRLYAGPSRQVEPEPAPVIDLVAMENGNATGESSHSDVDREDLVPTLPTPRHLYRRSDADRVDR